LKVLVVLVSAETEPPLPFAIDSMFELKLLFIGLDDYRKET